ERLPVAGPRLRRTGRFLDAHYGGARVRCGARRRQIQVAAGAHGPWASRGGAGLITESRSLRELSHDQPGAGVPTQNGIVVGGWSDRFSLLVPGHRAPQPVEGAGAVAVEGRVGAPLVDDAAVVRTVVLIPEPCDNLQGFRDDGG